MKNFICSILGLFVISIAQAQLKEITYKDGAQKLNGLYFAANKLNNDNAGILILPAWKGIDLHAKNSAEKLANLGYHTLLLIFMATEIILQMHNKPENAPGFTKKTTNNIKPEFDWH
jgi:hypothetical protein